MKPLTKVLFPFHKGFSFADEETTAPPAEKTEEVKTDTQANIKQVQTLIEAAKSEVRLKMQGLIDSAEEKYTNQVKRAKKSEDAAKHTDEAEEQLGNIKERMRLLEEERDGWKVKAAKSTENNIRSHITSAVSKSAQKLVDPSAESTLRMLMRPHVSEGKDEQIDVLGDDGQPRLKQSTDGKIVPFAVDDLTAEILSKHTYLLSSTSKGGSGTKSNRDGIQETSFERVSSMNDEELNEHMKGLTNDERKVILDQIKP